MAQNSNWRPKRLARIRFVSISSYTRAPISANSDVSYTPPGVPRAKIPQRRHKSGRGRSTQEFRLTSPSGGAFDWLAGIYGMEVSNLNYNIMQISNYPPPPMTALAWDYTTRRRDLAAFGTVDYRIGKLTSGAGVRLDDNRYTGHMFVGVTPGLPDQAVETTKAALPKASISYELAPGKLLYASAASGEEPGAVNVNAVAAIPYRAGTGLELRSRNQGTSVRSKSHL